MKKASLLFSITGCFCTGVATKPTTVFDRLSALWSGIDSGAITELKEHHLEGLSNSERRVTLDALRRMIFQYKLPFSFTISQLEKQMEKQVTSLRHRKALEVVGIYIILCVVLLGVLRVLFPDYMKFPTIAYANKSA
jgi:hypothetical protein